MGVPCWRAHAPSGEVILKRANIDEETAADHRRVGRAEVSLVARVRPVRSTIDMAHRVPALGVAVMDISTLGLSFLTDRGFSVDDLVEVELSWRGVDIFFHGVVRHVHERVGSPDLVHVGVQFLITPSTKHAVESLSEWLLQRGVN